MWTWNTSNASAICSAPCLRRCATTPPSWIVSTPELASAEGIGADPLPPGHAWGVSPGGQDEGPGLYRIEVNETPGSGVRITNVGAPGPLRESVQTAWQNLLSRNRDLIGDRD